MRRSHGEFVNRIENKSASLISKRSCHVAACSVRAAQQRLKEILALYALSAPTLAAWLEKKLPQGFTGFASSPARQARLRTSNAFERINQELRRRTRVARVFPNEPFLRLIPAHLTKKIARPMSLHWLLLHDRNAD
jgi:transposase-like protein